MGGEASEKAESERKVQLLCACCGLKVWFAEDSPEDEESWAPLCDECRADQSRVRLADLRHRQRRDTKLRIRLLETAGLKLVQLDAFITKEVAAAVAAEREAIRDEIMKRSVRVAVTDSPRADLQALAWQSVALEDIGRWLEARTKAAEAGK